MSFVKKGAVKAAELGTRPGLSGQTLVSTGLADFDKLLGGGVPLGTVVLLLEDNHTQNHSTLIKYFLAEGAANKQALYWSAGHARHASASRALPQQVQHTPKDDIKDKQQETDEVQLRIAWQYRRYIKSKQKAAANASTSSRSTGGSQSSKKAKAGSSAMSGVREWCHSFDLTKPTPVQDITTRMECSEFDGPAATQSLTSSITQFLDSLAPSSGASSASSAHPVQLPATGTYGQQGFTAGSASMAKLSIADSVAPGSDDAVPQSSRHAAHQSSGREQCNINAQSSKTLSPASSTPPSRSAQNDTAAPDSTAAGIPTAVKGIPMQLAVAPQERPHGVGRVVVESFGGLQWQLEGSDKDVERQLYTAVFWLKVAVRNSRSVAMVSLPAGLYSPSLTARLAHLCDTVIGLEAVRDDSDIVRLIPEPASCCGLLHLQKLPSLNALGPPLPDVSLFIIRHKRRRLAIQAVQIDPDAEAGETDTKSAAAALCGGPPKADKPFDF